MARVLMRIAEMPQWLRMRAGAVLNGHGGRVDLLGSNLLPQTGQAVESILEDDCESHVVSAWWEFVRYLSLVLCNVRNEFGECCRANSCSTCWRVLAPRLLEIQMRTIGSVNGTTCGILVSFPEDPARAEILVKCSC